MMEESAPESMNRSTCLPPTMPGFVIGGLENEPKRQGILTRLILRHASALWPFSPHLRHVILVGSHLPDWVFLGPCVPLL